MRVLITGHQGYIGSVLTRVLADAGHAVSGLDTAYYADCTFGEAPPNVPSARRDIRDVTAADLAGIEAVIHLAALSNDPLGELHPELTYAINERAAVRLAGLARDAGVRRFLFASSCSLYGAAGDTAVTEDALLRPLTHYATSKARVEEALLRLADERFSPVMVRSATVYGLSPRLRLDVVLNNLVAWAVTTGAIRVLSDGSPWRPLIHVQDLAQAYAALLEAPQEAVHAEAFNVGSPGENYQVRRLAAIVQEAMPGCRVAFGQGGPDARDYRVDFQKLAARVPQFRPQWTAARGAQELAHAFSRAGLGPEALEGPRYIRLRRLKQLLETEQLDEDLRWKAMAHSAACP